MNREDPLVETAILGKEAEEFLRRAALAKGIDTTAKEAAAAILVKHRKQAENEHNYFVAQMEDAADQAVRSLRATRDAKREVEELLRNPPEVDVDDRLREQLVEHERIAARLRQRLEQ